MAKDKYYGKTLRKNFARHEEVMAMPNLLAIQKNSYQWFLDTGLREVFADVASITDYAGNLELSFLDYSMNEPPKYDVEECKARDATYAAPMKVSVRLHNKETGEIKEQEIFMGDFPLMTESGTFVINGAERVVVSQIVRSPGIYYGAAEIDVGDLAARGLAHTGGLGRLLDAREVIRLLIAGEQGDVLGVELGQLVLHLRDGAGDGRQLDIAHDEHHGQRREHHRPGQQHRRDALARTGLRARAGLRLRLGTANLLLPAIVFAGGFQLPLPDQHVQIKREVSVRCRIGFFLHIGHGPGRPFV